MTIFNLNFNKSAIVNNAPLKKSFIKFKDCEVIIKLRELSRLNHQNIPYKNVIFIVSNVEVLKISYECIKKNYRALLKPTGFVSLKSLDLEWFNKASDLLKKGQFKFNRAGQWIMSTDEDFKSAVLDQIVQKALLLVLEAVYQPTFSVSSYGHTVNTNKHTALKQIKMNFKSVQWVYEADFSKCVDTLDHQILINILKEKLHCEKTIALIKSALACGYISGGTAHRPKIGADQASILSSLFFSVYFNKLDLYLASLKMACESCVPKRVSVLKYHKFITKLKTIKSSSCRVLLQKRFQYCNEFTFVRYEDTYLIGISSYYVNALFFLSKIQIFLKKVLKIQFKFLVSKIIFFSKSKVFFLGYLIKSIDTSLIFSFNSFRKIKTRKTSRHVSFYAPIKNLLENLLLKKYFKKVNNKFIPTKVGSIINLAHQEIIERYNQIIFGILNYYSFVTNKKSLKLLIHGLKMSAARTLALKYKYRSVFPVFKKFGKRLKCFKSSVEIFIPTRF